MIRKSVWGQIVGDEDGFARIIEWTAGRQVVENLERKEKQRVVVERNESDTAWIRVLCFWPDLGQCWIPDLKRERQRKTPKWLEERMAGAEGGHTGWGGRGGDEGRAVGVLAGELLRRMWGETEGHRPGTAKTSTNSETNAVANFLDASHMPHNRRPYYPVRIYTATS